MLEKISLYRTELMGFAIIWVILFHSKIGIPIVDNLYRIGYGGVDIFFFLSGFGLYFSFKKERNLLHFYTKRFIRVFPTYIVIVLITMLFLGDFSLLQFFVNISTLGFWIGKSYFEWYIPSLILFYLLFPLLFKLVNKNLKSFLLIILFITLVLVLIRIKLDFDIVLMFFITRIPIFSLGILLGKWTFDKKQLSKLLERLIYVSFIIGFITILFFINYLPRTIMWDYGLFWYPFILITPGLCAFIAFVLEILNKPIINKVLVFFGALSLELYLLHIKLFEKSKEIANYFDISRPVVLLVIIVLIVPVSIIISKLMSILYKWMDNYRTANNVYTK